MLERLKAFSPYGWMPILTVGAISATLVYRNLSLQQAGTQPEIKRQEGFSTNFRVDKDKFLDVLGRVLN
jgi:hypothetical protein